MCIWTTAKPTGSDAERDVSGQGCTGVAGKIGPGLSARTQSMKGTAGHSDNLTYWKSTGCCCCIVVFCSILSHNLGRSSGHHR